MIRAIDVVLQGPTSSDTTTVVDNWLRCDWVNQVIVSSWSGSKFSHENSRVKLILSDDPRNPGPGNVNRQIVSSQNGLKHVNTRFCIKSRTDLWPKGMDLMGLGIHRELNKYKLKGPFYKIAVLGRAHETLPFLVADMFQFGSTADLRNLWNVPLNKCTNKYGSESAVPSETYIFFPYFRNYDPSCGHFWESCVSYLSPKGPMKEHAMPHYKTLFDKLFLPLETPLWWPKKNLL